MKWYNCFLEKGFWDGTLNHEVQTKVYQLWRERQFDVIRQTFVMTLLVGKINVRHQPDQPDQVP